MRAPTRLVSLAFTLALSLFIASPVLAQNNNQAKRPAGAKAKAKPRPAPPNTKSAPAQPAQAAAQAPAVQASPSTQPTGVAPQVHQAAAAPVGVAPVGSAPAAPQQPGLDPALALQANNGAMVNPDGSLVHPAAINPPPYPQPGWGAEPGTIPPGSVLAAAQPALPPAEQVAGQDWADQVLAEGATEDSGGDETPVETPAGSMIWIIIATGVIVGVGWLVSKKYGQRKDHETTGMRHVQSMRLGTRHQIALVEVRGQLLVVGLAPGHVSLLTELADTAERPSVTPTPSAFAAFGARLEEALSRPKTEEPAAAREPRPLVTENIQETESPATRDVKKRRAMDRAATRVAARRYDSANRESASVRDRIANLRRDGDCSHRPESAAR